MVFVRVSGKLTPFRIFIGRTFFIGAYSFQIKKLPSREKFRSSPINMESKTSDSRLTELKLGRVIHVWLVNTNSKGKSFSLN
ncbi:unnamed protein product [Rhizophagus irregularis]|nr:unnamed protein product [Rhizophagus irregularis]